MYSMVLPIASMALGFGEDEPDINIFMSYWFWCLVSTQWWWGPALSLFLLSHLEHLLEETVQYFVLKQVNVGIFTYCINEIAGILLRKFVSCWHLGGNFPLSWLFPLR
jgi:hypothetical protein